MKNDTIEDILIIGLAAAVSYFVIKDLVGGSGTNKSSAGLPSFSKIPTSGGSGSSGYNPFYFSPSQILGPLGSSGSGSSSGNNLGYNFNPFSSTQSQIFGSGMPSLGKETTSGIVPSVSGLNNYIFGSGMPSLGQGSTSSTPSWSEIFGGSGETS
jgi:hypothetical protein